MCRKLLVLSLLVFLNGCSGVAYIDQIEYTVGTPNADLTAAAYVPVSDTVAESDKLECLNGAEIRSIYRAEGSTERSDQGFITEVDEWYEASFKFKCNDVHQ